MYRMSFLRPFIWSLSLIMATTASAQDLDPANTLIMELESGDVVVALRPDLAPKHAARLKELAREGFYDGVIFHRVIDGFMAQTGDPTGTGRGGSDKPNLPAEFSSESFERGTIGMARTTDPNSANSQFFINFVPTPHLAGQYTVVGEVVEGMEHIDALAKGEPPRNPDKIVSMRVAADGEGGSAAQ
jgi:cyclophilin family peptidyl-prolyl cis-trans isomerase